MICGKASEQVGPISYRGKCQACGEARNLANHRQLLAHSGPWFAHWRARCLASFGVVVVDDPEGER